MQTKAIRLDQGVEPGSPGDDVSPGALLLARNCFYEPESNILRRIWGRSVFGTVAAARLTGLATVRFRNGNRFLVASAGTTLATAPLGDTGSFTSRKTLASAAGYMEAAYYQGTDRLYIFDGVNAPQVWSGSGNTRDMGLLSPLSPLTLALVNNGGTTYPITTTFAYCFTEYDSANNIESGPSSVAQIASSVANSTFKLTIPTKRNSSADKFRIYRTESGGDVFFLLAEINSSLVRYYDGTDTEALGSGSNNTAVWGFATVDDLFLATRQTMPMLGTPITANYMTVNGAIPNGDIVTVFGGSLCVGGVVGYAQDWFYSLPDAPESFSPVYVNREEDGLGSPLMGLGTANDRLIVLLLNSIWRYDRLARITDPGFGIGATTRREVTRDHGCVAKRSVVQFSVGTPNNRLFYLSNRGPYVTDGYVTIPIGQDLDWSDRIVNFARLNRAVAINFPKYRVIALAVSSPSAAFNDVVWLYHYDPRHLKEATGVGKWTGPIHMRVAAGAVSGESTDETRLYTADDNASGQVYLEDNGLSDASQYENADGRIRWEWMTRDVRLGGMARNTRAGRVFLSHEGDTAFAPNLKVAMSKGDYEHAVPMQNQTLNAPDTETIGTSTLARVKSRTLRGGVWQVGSHIRLHMEETQATSDRAIVGAEIEVEDQGPQR